MLFASPVALFPAQKSGRRRLQLPKPKQISLSLYFPFLFLALFRRVLRDCIGNYVGRSVGPSVRLSVIHSLSRLFRKFLNILNIPKLHYIFTIFENTLETSKIFLVSRSRDFRRFPLFSSLFSCLPLYLYSRVERDLLSFRVS